MATVGLERTVYQVIENEGAVEVCAQVLSPSGACPIASSFGVTLITSPRSASIIIINKFWIWFISNYAAAINRDYLHVSTILEYPVCTSRQCVNVTIFDDATPEAEESFSVFLGEVPGTSVAVSSTSTVVIFDDDGKPNA